MANASTSDPILIVPLTDTEQMQSAVEIQRAAWGMHDLAVAPAHILTAVAKTGGLLLGAYVNDELIAFVLGLISKEGNEFYITSHMMGVRPEWQSHNVGLRLKCAQAEWAKRNGFRYVRWTFDPMETRNANLNIRKLGARVISFIPNYYGEGVHTTLQSGLPSDRFLVQWDVLTESPENSPRSGKIVVSEVEGEVLSRISSFDLGREEVVQIEVPLHFQELKQCDIQKARKWQTAVRDASLVLLSTSHFWISGFHADPEAALGYYVATRRVK